MGSCEKEPSRGAAGNTARPGLRPPPHPARQHCGGQEAQRLRRQARLDTLCAPWGEAKVTSRWAEGRVPAGIRSA